MDSLLLGLGYILTAALFFSLLIRNAMLVGNFFQIRRAKKLDSNRTEPGLWVRFLTNRKLKLLDDWVDVFDFNTPTISLIEYVAECAPKLFVLRNESNALIIVMPINSTQWLISDHLKTRFDVDSRIYLMKFGTAYLPQDITGARHDKQLTGINHYDYHGELVKEMVKVSRR